MSAISSELVPVWSGWTRLARPRTASVVVAAAAAGLAADLVFRNGPPTISGALVIFVVSAGLIVAGRPSNPQALALAAAAPLFGAWLAVRTNVWLLPVDILAAGGLLALAAAYARGGSVLDLSVPGAVLHAMRAAANALLAPAFLFGGASRTNRAAIVRGILLAIPLLVVLGTLLASADAVFASAIRVDGAELVSHALAIAFGAMGMSALVRLSSVEPASPPELGRPRLGATEWTIVLVCIDLLLAGFAAARVVALTQGGRRVIDAAGLTYAEYARSGFFQLIAASVIAFAALLALRALVDASDRRRFVVPAEVALALLLLVVAQAVQRLVLYERAFGLTMPRLLATAVCVWLGISLVALGVWIAGVGASRHWFWTVMGAAALALLGALNAVNAEAVIVHRNVAHAEATGHFDTSELGQLGDDAVPALEAALPRLSRQSQRGVVAHVCAPHQQGPGSWWAYNGARDGAIESRNRVCAGRTGS